MFMLFLEKKITIIQLLGDDSVLTEFHKHVSCLEMD